MSNLANFIIEVEIKTQTQYVERYDKEIVWFTTKRLNALQFKPEEMDKAQILKNDLIHKEFKSVRIIMF